LEDETIENKSQMSPKKKKFEGVIPKDIDSKKEMMSFIAYA